jgi:dolichol kinase
MEQYIAPNVKAFLVSTFVAVAWVEICKFLSYKGLLAPWQRRKMLHIVTGPLFIATWPLFSDDERGAQWAAAVPFIMTLKFIAVGMGWLQDDDMVLSASRTSQRADLLRGPTLYGVIFIASTMLYWKQLQAVICLFVLCFGDGFAEICGRSFGSGNNIFYSKDKSWAGFTGFVVSSIVATMGFLFFYGNVLFGNSWLLSISPSMLFWRVTFDCVIAGFVETLPLSDIDNLTVFGAAILANSFFTFFFSDGSYSS